MHSKYRDPLHVLLQHVANVRAAVSCHEFTHERVNSNVVCAADA
jgi:hypothetical protein